MNREQFEQALEQVLREGRAEKGIGTLGERTLHAVLKRYLEPFEENHEARTGPYVADIVGEQGIIEIQTRSFNRLREKLAVFLEVAEVTVVYPIAAEKQIIWVDPETGEVTPPRKSPKRGGWWDACYELYKIKGLLTHPNLRLHLILLDMEEYRQLNGWSHDRKRGASRWERIPTALVDEVILRCPADYLQLLPPELPAQFTTRDYGRGARLRLNRAQEAVCVLHHVGAVRRCGKAGRLLLYEAAEAPVLSAP